MNKILQIKTKMFQRVLFVCLLLILNTVTIISHATGIPNVVIQQQINQKKVTLNFKVRPLADVLKEIKKQTAIDYVINSEIAQEIGDVTINVTNVTVDVALKTILQDSEYEYTVMNNHITFVKKTAAKNQNSPFTLKGIILDSNKKPIVGATIFTVGTTHGAITDAKGNFVLKTSVGSSIEVSYVGKKTTIKKITSEELVIINMDDDNIVMDNVIVTGYSTINKTSFTGNYTSVNGSELKNVSSRNIVSALQVFDPSLRIKENLQYGSDPNALPEFSIRGNSSMGVNSLDAATSLSKSNIENNSNLPIFILDGFEVSVEKVYDMDVDRIENITILKDAAATAMYGSRAANGVIVITSIRPKTGDIRITYNFLSSLVTPDLTDYNLMNASEKLNAELLAGLYNGDNENENTFLMAEYNYKKRMVDSGIDTDWLSLPLKNIYNHKHTIYVEGGDGGFKFGLGLKYSNNDGVMKKSFRDTYGANLTLDYVYKKFQIRNEVLFDMMKSQESPYGMFSDYARKQPYDKYFDENNNYLKKTNGTLVNDTNPIYNSQLNGYDKTKYDEIRDNIGINWYLNDAILLKGQFSLSKKITKSNRFKDPDDSSYSESLAKEYRGEITTRDGSDFEWSTNILFLFNKNIKKNYINFTAGLNASSIDSDQINAQYRGISLSNMDDISFAKEIVKKPTNNASSTRLIGYLASLNYTYDNIYLFDASVRLDGSSLFGTDKKYAPFWSVGAGINVSKYKFFKNNVVTELRLRGSYGSLGKINFPPYRALSMYNINNDKSYSTGNVAILQAMGNSALTWETTKTLDLGIEFKLFRDALDVRFAYYNKETIDLITDVTLPSSSGFTTYSDNLGGIVNKGMEINLRSNIYQTKEMNIVLYANMNRNKNEITSISNSLKKLNEEIDQYLSQYPTQTNSSPNNKPLTKYIEGGSTTSIFAMQSAGIDPTNGKEKFIRRDGSSSYVWSAADQIIVGNSLPDFQGSFGLNLRYKDLSLFASFMYEYGAQAYNYVLVDKVENADIKYSNVDKRVLYDRWIKPGDVTPLKDIKDRNFTTKPSSRFVQDKNVLSCQSISLRYDLKAVYAKKIGFNSISIQVSAENPFRWSTVKEERGISYPFARTYNLTINVSL